jgi:hypothetical protein
MRNGGMTGLVVARFAPSSAVIIATISSIIESKKAALLSSESIASVDFSTARRNALQFFRIAKILGKRRTYILSRARQLEKSFVVSERSCFTRVSKDCKVLVIVAISSTFEDWRVRGW